MSIWRSRHRQKVPVGGGIAAHHHACKEIGNTSDTFAWGRQPTCMNAAEGLSMTRGDDEDFTQGKRCMSSNVDEEGEHPRQVGSSKSGVSKV
jgi:hypothetical protein